MDRIELLSLHQKLCEQARNLMEKKNHDYGANSDIFKNFRRFGTHGICVRLDDKVSRLESFCEKGCFAVEDEKLEDTVTDIVNYAILFLAMSRSEKTDRQPILTHKCE